MLLELWRAGEPDAYLRLALGCRTRPSFDGHMRHPRSGATGLFMIHADSLARPGTASEGCVILDPTSRKKLAECHGGTLDVTP